MWFPYSQEKTGSIGFGDFIARTWKDYITKNSQNTIFNIYTQQLDLITDNLKYSGQFCQPQTG